MHELKKYPKIRQFRDIFRKIRSSHDFKGFEDDETTPIYRHDSPYPILRFQGTVKLHGTNGAIGFDEKGDIWVQSRNRVLTVQSDNQEFAHFVKALPDEVKDELYSVNRILYGEWCGGSIQRGIAINGLPKMFVILSIKDIALEKWTTDIEFSDILNKGLNDCLDILNKHNIYVIDQFTTYEIDIDFGAPELMQNKLVEITSLVANECPVGKHFGVSGIGEGVVWKCASDGFESSDFWFKVKDERHSASKVKKLTVNDPAIVQSIQDFVSNTVTANRLNQGIDYLKEMKIPLDIKSTGDFLRWVFNDIIEEDFDMLVESGLTKKDVGSQISRKAREFWLNRLNEEFGL